MCGQFYISNDILKATRNYAPISHFEQEQLHFGTIYPSAKTLVLCRQEDHIAAKIMRFGIEYKGFKKALINARSETVLSKWMFRSDFIHSRVAIPVCSFYEWTADQEKIIFTRSHHSVFFIAGFCQDDQFIILTREANESMSPYHSRMPLLLKDDQVLPYLTDLEMAKTYLKEGSFPLEAKSADPQIKLF